MNGEWQGGDPAPEDFGQWIDEILGAAQSCVPTRALHVFLFKDILDSARVLLRSTGATFEFHTTASRPGLFDDPASRATQWWSDTYNFAARHYIETGAFSTLVLVTENPAGIETEILPL